MLLVGNDWAEDHHDVELVDESGHRLARKRLNEGIEGITQLHELIARHLPEDAPASAVVWLRQRQGNQLRSQLREYFPAAVDAFPDLTGRDALAIVWPSWTPHRPREQHKNSPSRRSSSCCATRAVSATCRPPLLVGNAERIHRALTTAP